MDAKALAKSKRAHSQQHSRRHHPNQKSKAPSGGATEPDAGGAKRPPGKQVREKSVQSRVISALPSNWDRYDEENDSGSEDPSGTSATKTPDVVLPKSKGADYRHLIAEAQSQSQSHLYPDSFPSVDDVLAGEFSQAVGSMLSVKGEGILAWSGDDNFLVEDKTTSYHEASFLSLNLHALAEQLSKIDLSQRLFIEADLLPPELCAEISGASNIQESVQIPPTNDSAVVKELPEELIDSLMNVEVVDPSSKVASSTSPGSGHPDTSLSIGESSSTNQVYVDITSVAKSDDQSKVPEFTVRGTVNFFADSNKKLAKFEAAAVEAELDMLLNSFTEVKILNSASLSSADTRSGQEASAPEFQLPRKNPGSSVSTTANLDDDLDDLLNQTSSLMNQNNPFEAQGERGDLFVQSSLPQSGTKSKPLDDFDSWLDTI
ncbi:phosphorelay protein [Trema orientale]|uniref:Phosphorelay protein n=1 Tax=Trema orientale TaxID=63057 RepID=A0A2P5FJ91_TREOI|nr:phosphorelay protein [Trema orientale]